MTRCDNKRMRLAPSVFFTADTERLLGTGIQEEKGHTSEKHH